MDAPVLSVVWFMKNFYGYCMGVAQNVYDYMECKTSSNMALYIDDQYSLCYHIGRVSVNNDGAYLFSKSWLCCPRMDKTYAPLTN